MSIRFLFRGLVAVALMLVLVTPVFAGGWTVTTLDELPVGAVTNAPLTVGFMIRQHGETPWQWADVKVHATNEATDEIVAAHAVEQDGAGHYVATLTFPSAGVWNWSIESGLMPLFQPMPALNVTSLGEGMAGLPRVIWTGDVRLAPANHAARLRGLAANVSAAEQGQALFLAKGCVVCHTHPAAASQQAAMDFFTIGPNLTHLNVESEYLHNWLQDPSAIKPGAQMPTLGLKEAEIDALVSFLMPVTAGQ